MSNTLLVGLIASAWVGLIYATAARHAGSSGVRRLYRRLIRTVPGSWRRTRTWLSPSAITGSIAA
jgi:hypothetical protein